VIWGKNFSKTFIYKLVVQFISPCIGHKPTTLISNVVIYLNDDYLYKRKLLEKSGKKTIMVGECSVESQTVA